MNPATRSEQAADWFLRLREEATEEELREWTQWCAADAENLREYERIRTTWQGFDRVQPAEVTHAPVLREFLSSRRALAAAIAVVAVAASGVLAWQSGMLSPDKQVLSAHRIENQAATLPDGSTLTLAPRTQAAVDFSGPQRRIDLSAGEAYFKVAPNKQEPFIVQAAGLKVTALGTAFNIKSQARSLVVTVEEGLIEAANGTETWRVGAGYQLAYDLDRHAARLAAVDPQRELSWREGRLEYVDAPLPAVVADINRYSNRPIELADPQLAQLTYTGTLFTRALEDWLSAMQSTFPIQVETREDRVLLRSRMH